MDRPILKPSIEPEERDTLLMGLVESVLARAIEERKAFLDTVATRYPELYDEVTERVAWEDRMGGFLRQPLIVARTTGPENPFTPGEVVSGRFRIVRELGRGGMGVVYEASDEKLNRRIAVKCARREFQSRLTPEAHAALEVSHPNVCKLHELHTAQTAGGPVDFLTMEFVEGETLHARIDREGPLPDKDVREIALQICAGLAQAHLQGVVHGDIKAGNVILSRTPEGAMRAVLTDFGLAKLILERTGSSDDAASRAASIQGGTLAYMAPELFSGSRSSIASDVYALGVLLHQMLTGKVIKRHPPDAPVRIDLPKPWNRIVARCIEVKPENRFASVEDAVAIFTGRRAIVKWALAAALAVIVVLALFLWRSGEETGPPVRLVVLPVAVEGPPIAAAGGLGADVANRLSGARRSFTVIGPEEALRNHVDTTEKAKSVLGATHVLRTDLHSSGAQISATASLADTSSGQSLRELKGEYPVADTALIAKALIATVTGAFGLRSRVPREPTSGPAYQDYVQGVALMKRDTQSADEAIPHFVKAAQLDPRSALPYAGLADAQMQKFTRGEGGQWLDLAGENVAKAKSLNPDSVAVLLSAGYVAQARGRYEEAISEYNRAAQLEPQDAEVWRRLALAYERSNRTQEAITSYQKAIQAQPDYELTYLSFGTFYLRRSQYRESEEIYRRATIVAPALPSGHLDLGLSLMRQGKLPEAEKELLEALRLGRNAQILMNVGALYYLEERYSDAVRFFEESISLGPPTAVRYIDLADGYRHLDRAADSQQAYRAGRRLAENDVSRNPRSADSRALLALFAARVGDTKAAEFEMNQALALQPENAIVKRNGAISYEVLHRRDKALELLRTAPPFVLDDLSRDPDTKELSRDPDFQAMMHKISTQ